MFDAHVKTAVESTQTFYSEELGMQYSFEEAASLFRMAASIWSQDRLMVANDLEEMADRHEYELSLEEY